jgi:serine/threonine-protein kinase RsbW
MGSDVSVSVPARAEFVHVLRSVIASIAARAQFTFDEIDDLRLALDEACAQLLLAGRGTTLTVTVRPVDGGGLEVLAWVDADDLAWPPSGAEHGFAWQILSALADEARFDRADGHPALRILKRRAPAGTR